MHKNFGEWYRLVSIEPNGELLEKRWAAVEEWAARLQGDDASLLDTVRIFRGIPPKSMLEEFLKVFRAHDTAFPQRNELELQVLAGASLVACAELFDGDEVDSARAAIIAGTAVKASSLHKEKSNLNEISEEIQNQLHNIARDQRQRGAFNTDIIDSKLDALNAEIEQVTSAGDWAQLKTQIVPILKKFLGAIHRSETALEVAVQSLRCADEENNILWWLEGRCSRDLNTPWISLPKESIPLIAGKELADITDISLGPQDAAALLHRVVTASKCKKLSIQTCVNSVPEEWCKRIILQGGQIGLDLAPLWSALDLRCKSDTASWPTFFESALGLNPSTSLPPERIAEQAYFEAMLSRTLADVED